MKKLLDDVTAFHRKFNVPVLPSPQVPPDERVRLRARLMVEEFLETLEAMFDCYEGGADWYSLKDARVHLSDVVEGAEVRVNLPDVADGIVDQAYILAGTALEFGLREKLPLVHDAVHAANMKKEADPNGGKVKKPAGWQPPDVAGILFGADLDAQRIREQQGDG